MDKNEPVSSKYLFSNEPAIKNETEYVKIKKYSDQKDQKYTNSKKSIHYSDDDDDMAKLEIKQESEYKRSKRSRKYSDNGDSTKLDTKKESQYKYSKNKDVSSSDDYKYSKSKKYRDYSDDEDRKSKKSRKYSENSDSTKFDTKKESQYKHSKNKDVSSSDDYKYSKSKKYRDYSDDEDRKSKKSRKYSENSDSTKLDTKKESQYKQSKNKDDYSSDDYKHGKSKKYRDYSDDEDRKSRKSKKSRKNKDYSDEDKKYKNKYNNESKHSEKRKRHSHSKTKNNIDSDEELYNRLLEKKMRGNSYNEKSSSREISPKQKGSKSAKNISLALKSKTDSSHTNVGTKQELTSATRLNDTTHTQQPSVTTGRAKRSRWGNDSERAVIPGIPVAIGKELSEDQQKLYLLQFKIEEIGLKLRTGNLGIKPEDSLRSPSPEPIYNSQGIRQNTREARIRQRLDEERHRLIREALKLNPDYIPPADFKPNSHRFTDKVPIPQSIHPNVNFIGLIIGPRGNTLKKLENETGCKIIIRGQGSLKDGKANGLILPGADEPLHALITAMNEDCLRRGIATINKIINDGLSNPDGDNELRRSQLRELALLNGTLIASEVSRCKNCGSGEHRHWECPHQQNLTSIITCSKCGGAGHLDSDCIFQGERAQTAEEKSKMDIEYQDLMEELGVKRNEITFETKTNVPSILALPKYMVSQLPWVNTASGNLGSTFPPSGPLALPPTGAAPQSIISGIMHPMMPVQQIIPGVPIVHAMPPASTNYTTLSPPPPPPSFPNTNTQQPPKI